MSGGRGGHHQQGSGSGKVVTGLRGISTQGEVKGRTRHPAGMRATETQGAEEADTPQGLPLPPGTPASRAPRAEPLCLFLSIYTSPPMAWGCPWGSADPPVCPPSSASSLSSREVTVHCSHSPWACPFHSSCPATRQAPITDEPSRARRPQPPAPHPGPLDPSSGHPDAQVVTELGVSSIPPKPSPPL